MPKGIRCRTNLKKAVTAEYKRIIGKDINWDNPQEIDEKLAVLKIGEYYNNPIITKASDKVLAKDYVKEHGYPIKCAKTYAVYDRVADIRWDELPKQCVIKCNHGCQYNIIVPDKDKLDIKETKRKLRHWMKENYWVKFVEPQYRFIDRKIMVEEFLGTDLPAFKYYCFHGEPKIMYVSNNGPRGPLDKEMYLDYFDMDFTWQDMRLRGHENLGADKIAKPDKWEEMKSLASEMAEDYPFVRVDFYDVDGEIYFSEMTFLPSGGYMRFAPESVAMKMGSWL